MGTVVESRIPLLHRACQLDAAVDADVPVVIGGQRHLHADDLADGAHPVGEPGDALVGDFDAGEWVHDAGVLPDVHPGRHRERAGDASEQADSEILLQVGNPRVHAGLQSRRLLLRIGCLRRVRVEPHVIAELAAQHLPARHAPRLARQIHQRHLDAADTAGLPGVVAELLDLAEDLVDVARVLAEDPALEDQRIGLAASIANFAVPRDALVRVDPDERHRHGRADDHGHAQVRDLEGRGLRRPLDVGLHQFCRRRRAGLCAVGKGGGRHRTGGDPCRPEEIAPIELSSHRWFHSILQTHPSRA
jgi:hypothetical protein